MIFTARRAQLGALFADVSSVNSGARSGRANNRGMWLAGGAALVVAGIAAMALVSDAFKRNKDEIDAVLDTDADLFKRIYDVWPNGNWEGHTILNRLNALELLSDDDEMILAVARANIAASKATSSAPLWP